MAPLGDNDTNFLLGRLEGKVDAVLAAITEMKQHAADLERRITSLERWKWTVMGGAAALSLIADYVLRLLKN